MGANIYQPKNYCNMNTVVTFKPIFQLVCDIDYGDNDEYMTEREHMH